MSTQRGPLGAFLALALLCSLFPALTSCASSGRPADRSVEVTGRLTSEFEALGVNASAVGAAVDVLRTSVERQGIINRESVAVGDIDSAFKSFRKAIAGVRSSKKQLASSRVSLQKAMDSYVKSWDKEIASYESEDLKKRSQERRDDALARFARVSEELTAGGQEVDAYISRISDLESALAHDLTPGGINALDDELQKAGADGKRLGDVASKIAAKLREYAGTLQASTPATPITPQP